MKAEQYFEKGVHAFQNKDYLSSVSYFNTAAELGVDKSELWIYLGDSYGMLKQYKKAEDAYRKGVILHGENIVSLYRLGQVLLRNGKYKEAILILEKSIASQESVQTINTFAPLWYELGVSYYKDRQYYKALDSVNNAIEIENRYLIAWDLKGRIYYDLECYEQAKSAFRKAISLNNSYADSWEGIGKVYHELCLYKKAKYAFERAISLDEKFPAPWHGLGRFYYEYDKNYNLAMNCCNRAIFLDSNYGSPWMLLGCIYCDALKQYDRAKYAFKEAIKLNKYDAGSWDGLGNVHINGSDNNLEQLAKLAVGQKYFLRALHIKPTRHIINHYIRTYKHHPKQPYFLYRFLRNIDRYKSQNHELNTLNQVEKQCRYLLLWDNWIDKIRKSSLHQRKSSIEEKTLINYFMGDPMQTEYLCKQLIDKQPNNLFAYYYWFLNCTEWVKEQLPVIESAERHFNYYVDNKPLQNISTEEQKQRYYAALLLYADTDTAEAIECMEHTWMTHLPSAYFYLFLQFELEREQLFKERLHSQKEEIKNRYANQKQQAKATAIKEEWEDDKLKYLLQEIIEKEERQLSNAKDLELISESEYRKILSDNAICQQVTQHIIEREIADEEQEPMKFAYGFAPQNLDPNRSDWWTAFFHYAHYFELSEAIGIFRLAAQAYNFDVKSPSELKPFWETWKIKESDIIRMQEDIRKHELERVGEAFLMESKKHYHTLRERVIADPTDLKSEVNKLIFGIRLNTNLAKKRAVFDLERSVGRAEQSVAGTLADLIEELAMEGDVSAYYYMIGFYFLMREITEEDAVILQFYTNYVVNFSNESLSKITQGGLKDQFKSAFGEAYDLSSAGVTAVNPIAGLTMSALKPLAKGTMGELFVQYLNQLPPHKMVMRYFFPRTKKVQLYTDRKQNPDDSSVVTRIENTTPQLNRSLETVEIEDIPAFKKSFLLYIGQLKKDIGEEQFAQKYPLYGFEEWISLSKKQ